MQHIEKPKYLVTNPIHNCFKKILIQKEWDIYLDIFGEVQAHRIRAPLKIYKIPNTNNPKDYGLDLIK